MKRRSGVRSIAWLGADAVASATPCKGPKGIATVKRGDSSERSASEESSVGALGWLIGLNMGRFLPVIIILGFPFSGHSAPASALNFRGES